MQAEPFISRILGDEGLTDGLTDPEARLLIEWLVERAEQIAAAAIDESAGWTAVTALCRRARSIRQFVTLWCHRRDHAAATQLAGAEKLDWTLPSPDCSDPYDVLKQILDWELSHSPVAAVRTSSAAPAADYAQTPVEY